MTTITQTMKYRQAIINYANKYGVTKQLLDTKQTVNMFSGIGKILNKQL